MEHTDVRKKRFSEHSQPRSRSRTRQTRFACFRCYDAHRKIAELEARLSAENERRERERAASEIEGIKKQVRDRYLAFASAIAGIRDATELAVEIVPE